MTIIVFLIDTSASMNQRAYLGGRPTLLDVAKGAVETFVKVRQRCPESRGDRYMLLTFEEPPTNIKAGWKENLATFMNELKNLHCVGMTTMGAALKHAFDVLNINRMQTGIDTYGQGRCPFFLEPSVIVVITDGGKLSNNSGVQEDFNLPMHSPIPGSELTREPFRWDQRLFSLVLRLAGTPAIENMGLVPSDSSPIDAMCEVTGGRSYCITSHRMLMQCIDSLVQKVQSGVVINFEKIGPDPLPVSNEVGKQESSDLIILEDGDSRSGPEKDWDREFCPVSEDDSVNKNGVRAGSSAISALPLSNSTAWHSCRRLIYVPRSAQKGFAVGFWPIPESFWPDVSSSALPPRSAHPNVKFTCTSQEPMAIESLPFDKYELEPSPLTQYILARKQPTICWQVFIANSYKNSEVGHPFGYLKASTHLTCVNLFVMPYNYPVLLPLLDELIKVHRMKPTNEWRIQFQSYMRTMPSYYAGPLRRALTRMNVPGPLVQTLIPDTLDNSLSYSVVNYLKRLKNQAKIEFDRLCSEVGSKAVGGNVSSGKSVSSSSSSVNEGIRVAARSSLKKDLVSHPLLQDKFTSLREQLNEFGGFVVGLAREQCQKSHQSYRNPFDIPRRSLLDQVVRMRANFLQPSTAWKRLADEDNLHSMPVGQMGNYQEYLKRMQPHLREIESTPVRQHMFGNPFKIDKRMMVDEADIDLVGSGSGSPGSGGSSKGSLKRTASHSGIDPGSPRPPNKRKPGPIPKDVFVRRPTSPMPALSTSLSPPPSPAYVWSSSSFVTDPLPPVLTPVLPFPNQPSSLSDMESDDSNSPELDIGGSEPPKLIMVNGGDGENGGPPHLGPRCISPPLQDSLAPPVLVPLANHFSQHSSFVRPSPPSSPSFIHSLPGVNENREDYVESREQIGSNHVGTVGQETSIRNWKISPRSELSKKEIADIKRHNLNVRALAYKEVRRPGKNFAPLFTHLNTLKGDLNVKATLLKEVIRESLRFKRRTLACLLEDFLASIMNNTNNSNSLLFHPQNNGATRLS